MRIGSSITVGKDLQALYGQGTSGGLSDGELLERFAARRDEVAFEALVRRHGPMVFGACRRILGNSHDAEDAFQATFLVLARKAASIARRELVAGWLYAVARQTAKKARALNARKQTRERQVAQLLEPELVARDRWDDRLQLLDEELSRLPDRYRLPVLLCEIEGKTHQEAADQLGWPVGTVSGRLSRARTILGERLSRRDRSLSSASLPALFVLCSAPASLPFSVVSATVRAASALGAGTATTGVISAEVATLTNVMMRVLLLKRLGILVLFLTIGCGGGLTTFRALASTPFPSGEAPGFVARGSTPEPKSEQDRKQARSALDRAIKDVDAIEDLTQRCWILNEIARAQARARLWDDLAKTQRKLVQAANETEHTHRLIDAAQCLAETGDLRTAVEIATALQPDFQRDRALAEIASAQARAGDFEGAKQTTAMIHGAGDQGIAAHAIAKAHAERRDFERALQIAQAMASEFDKVNALADIAAAQLHARDPAFRQTLNRAKVAAAVIPIFIGNSKEPSDSKPYALAQIAGILAEANAVDEAKQVASGITKPPWQDMAWKNIAKAQADRGETDAALKSTNSIQNADQKSESAKNIVAALVQHHDLPRATSLAGSIAERLWSSAARLEIAKGQARAGQPAAAAEIFDQILAEARQRKDDSESGAIQRASLFKLAAAQAEVGDETKALSWIENLDSPHTRAWALVSLATAIAKRHPDVHPPTPAIARALPLTNRQHPLDKASRGSIDSFRGRIVLIGSVRYDDLAQSTSRIEVMNSNGTGLTTILILNKGENPIGGRVSPDGRYVVVGLEHGDTARRADLWSVDPSGKQSKIEAQGWPSAWSPDGKFLACFSGSPNDWESVILEVKTGQARHLAIPFSDWVEDWSPDGKTLAVVAGNPERLFKHPTKGDYPLRQIYLMNADGTGRHDLTTGPMLDSIWARFSPDGKQLVYHERRHQDGRVLHFAVVQNGDGTGRRDLISFNDVYAGNAGYRPNGHPCWSPDGTRVAWLIPRKKLRDGDTRMELLVILPSTGHVERVDLHSKGIMWVQAMDWR